MLLVFPKYVQAMGFTENPVSSHESCILFILRPLLDLIRAKICIDLGV